MKAVIQRVREASVTIGGTLHAHIHSGLLVLLGVHRTDNESDAAWLAGKIAKLRIFGDADGHMNLSVQQVGGEVLVVSQFTLLADCIKGARPSFIAAAPPAQANDLYRTFVGTLEAFLETPVQTGEFGADMQVALLNDGPVTILIDSKARDGG